MAGDTANPRIWLGADVYVAPVGTTAPTDTTTPLDAGFLPIGLLHEDGMTMSRDEDVTDHYAYGSKLIRTTRQKHKRTLKVTALEDNVAVFGLANPGSTASTTTGTTTRVVMVPTSNPQAFVFELVDGDVTKRLVVPRGEVTEVGDMTISDSEICSQELTITVYAASDGELFREITDDAQADVGA